MQRVLVVTAVQTRRLWLQVVSHHQPKQRDSLRKSQVEMMLMKFRGNNAVHFTPGETLEPGVTQDVRTYDTHGRGLVSLKEIPQGGW